MSYLAGLNVIEVVAAAPNMGRGETGGNVSPVKQFSVAGRRYPYISAQAWRRWLRDTIAAGGVDPSPVEFPEGRKQQAYTAGRPDRYFDDDIFGYMRAIKGHETQRETVLATSPLVSVQAYRRIPSDFGTMTRGLAAREQEEGGEDRAATNPLIHEHEFYSGDMVGILLVDLPRLGRFVIDEDGARRNLLTDEAQQALEDGRVVEGMLRGLEVLELPLEQRRERAALLLEAIACVHGGANRNSNYTDLAPSLLALVAVKGGVNPLDQVVTTDEVGETVVDLDVLEAELNAWRDQLDGPALVGWRPGFLRQQRDKAVAAYSTQLEAADTGEIVIEHPRTVLSHLAERLRAGAADGWLEP